MGKTFSTGLLTNGVFQDSSNNIGIGGAANASYKFQVTGATNLTDALTGTSATFERCAFVLPPILAPFAPANGIYLSNSNQLTLTTDSGQRLTIDYQGNVGIATTSPSTKLDVNGTGRFTSSLGIGITPFANTLSTSLDMVNGAGLWGYSNDFILTGNAYYNSGWLYKASSFATRINGDGAGAILFSNAASGTAGAGLSWNERMRITSSGYVGIGTSSPAAKLQVMGSGNPVLIYSDNNTLSLGLGYQGAIHGYLGGFSSRLEAYSNNGGYVYLSSSSTWVAASDVNRKRNFETYNLGLDAILGLKPKRYNMDFQENGDEKQVGFIAQEVKEFIPQAFEQSEDFIGINYNVIIVTLVNAIQELKAEIDELKAK